MHLLAFQQSVTATALTAINGVTDTILTPAGATRFLVPNDHNFIWWAIATGANLSRAQIITPTLQVRRMSPEIHPRSKAAELLNVSRPEIFVPQRPIQLSPSETIEADVIEGTGPSQCDVFVSLGPQALPAMPDGDLRIVRATGTTTLVARAWTLVPLTLDNSLEPGMYSLVGFVGFGATPVVARAVITGANFRPGVPMFSTTEAIGADFSRADWEPTQYYDMGRFSHINVPAIEVFATAADTVQTFYLYLVRTGDYGGNG